MDDSEALGHLTAALQEPEGKYSHDQIRAKINELAARNQGGLRTPETPQQYSPPAPEPEDTFGARMQRGGHRAMEEIVKPSLAAVNRVADTATFGAVGKAEKGLAQA